MYTRVGVLMREEIPSLSSCLISILFSVSHDVRRSSWFLFFAFPPTKQVYYCVCNDSTNILKPRRRGGGSSRCLNGDICPKEKRSVEARNRAQKSQRNGGRESSQAIVRNEEDGTGRLMEDTAESRTEEVGERGEMGSDQKWDWVSRHGAETERKESKPNLLRIGINMTLASPKTAAFLFAPFGPRSGPGPCSSSLSKSLSDPLWSVLCFPSQKAGAGGPAAVPPLPSGGRPGPGSRLSQGCRDGLDPQAASFLSWTSPGPQHAYCGDSAPAPDWRARTERQRQRHTRMMTDSGGLSRSRALCPRALRLWFLSAFFSVPGLLGPLHHPSSGHLKARLHNHEQLGFQIFSPVDAGVSWIVCTTTSPKPKRRVSWRVPWIFPSAADCPCLSGVLQTILHQPTRLLPGMGPRDSRDARIWRRRHTTQPDLNARMRLPNNTPEFACRPRQKRRLPMEGKTRRQVVKSSFHSVEGGQAGEPASALRLRLVSPTSVRNTWCKRCPHLDGTLADSVLPPMIPTFPAIHDSFRYLNYLPYSMAGPTVTFRTCPPQFTSGILRDRYLGTAKCTLCSLYLGLSEYSYRRKKKRKRIKLSSMPPSHFPPSALNPMAAIKAHQEPCLSWRFQDVRESESHNTTPPIETTEMKKTEPSRQSSSKPQ
ncbi:hypothetical protein CCUS01_11907 [Colletotrichum cuscutae]|uniref:Uncharacterized protein n=1 Tax=Colletotrichum cuscutae TaxID=1209917 RepID=A0AAI9XH83_9PEZI|nr:hypothetical protein CCUS01_11907 [Colletotrichum cuscutae]